MAWDPSSLWFGWHGKRAKAMLKVTTQGGDSGQNDSDPQGQAWAGVVALTGGTADEAGPLGSQVNPLKMAGAASKGSATSGLMQIGLRGSAGTVSAVLDGQVAEAQADLGGRLIATLGAQPLGKVYGRAILTTTAETTVIAATASRRSCLAWLTIANRDNVAHTVDIRTTTGGAVRDTIIVPAGDTRRIENVITADAPENLNTNITVQLREAATTAVEISGMGVITAA